MFKPSDLKVGDILIVNDAVGREYKVLEAEKKGNLYGFYIENLQTKVRYCIRIPEEAKDIGIAKIIHA